MFYLSEDIRSNALNIRGGEWGGGHHPHFTLDEGLKGYTLMLGDMHPSVNDVAAWVSALTRHHSYVGKRVAVHITLPEGINRSMILVELSNIGACQSKSNGLAIDIPATQNT